MQVRLVRHGHAGAKECWPGDDAARPLDSIGWSQADALRDALVRGDIGRLRSSPARRCVQTLEPLAAALGLTIETVGVLAADTDAGVLCKWLVEDTADGDVLCTHGETMARLLDELSPGSVAGTGDVLAKGSYWEIEIDDGRIERITHRLPEASDAR